MHDILDISLHCLIFLHLRHIKHNFQRSDVKKYTAVIMMAEMLSGHYSVIDQEVSLRD